MDGWGSGVAPAVVCGRGSGGHWLAVRVRLVVAALGLAALPCALMGRGARADDIPSWLNPATAPVLLIPDIETDPDSGNTFGIMPTWLKSNQKGDITRIASADFYRNSYFGAGVGGSIFDFLSLDSQWYVGGDVEQRVERQLDTRYESGRRRLDTWSFTARVNYDRIGTPRFFGIGNHTTINDQTNYTSETELIDLTPGWNINPRWQLAYTLRFQNVDVFPGSLPHIESIEKRFASAYATGDNREIYNRLMLIYDTRNDLTAPTQGVELSVYSGYAELQGYGAQYQSAGVDGRAYVPFGSRTVVALHTALRYELDAHHLPFWAYSTLGGEASVTDGSGTLRGYGNGRFTDRNSFVFNLELRQGIATLNAASSRIDVELTPFLDAGRVFHLTSTNPLSQLHYVGGLGFRGVARPFVVGYVDIGVGSEGVAVFTGINYPF